MKNKKGFTLIELLVTITILGIITIIALPTINKSTIKNNDRKFDAYRKSLAYSGKVYTDSYSDDMFGHRQKGCVIVPISKLIEKKLIDDIQIKNMSCNDDQYSYVIVNKFKGKYYFKAFLGCGIKNGSNIRDIKLYPESRAGASLCDESSDINMTFTTKPVESHDKTKKNLPISVLLTSASGAKKNAVIKYAFATTRGDLSSVKSSWGTLDTSSFTGEATQLQKIIEGEIPTLRFKDIKLENLSGKFFLVLDINQLYDINSDSYLKPDNSNKYFWSNKTFDIDNSKPVINIFSVETQASGYNSIRPKAKLIATDNNNLSANSELKMCLKVGSSSCSESDWISYQNNRIISSITSYGTTYSVNVKVRDAAKNVSDLKTFSYKVTPKVKLTYNSNGGSACSAKEAIQGTPWGTLCTPSKAHYTFVGWYHNGSLVKSTTIAQNNITVTAKWEPRTYYITYAGNGGVGSTGPTACKYNEICYFAANGFSLPGYDFTGWFTASGVQYGAFTTLTENITVYAHWHYNAYLSGGVIVNCYKDGSSWNGECDGIFPFGTYGTKSGNWLVSVTSYYIVFDGTNTVIHDPGRMYCFWVYGYNGAYLSSGCNWVPKGYQSYAVLYW